MVEAARERAGSLAAAGAEILALEEGATLAGAVDVSRRAASRR